jgi:putative protein-disulfide isomerase
VEAVHAVYYTDPACPWSWAREPAMWALRREFGEGVAITYVMGGLAREFGPAETLVAEWLDAADASGMPVDPRLWRDSAPRSSFPACLAVKAAAEQGLEAPLLRRLRMGLLAGRRKLDTTEALVEEARGVPGLDVARFRIDLASNAIVEAFASDLERAGDRRARLPVLAFGDAATVGRAGTLGDLRAAARAAGAPAADGSPPPGVEEALRRHGPVAAAEVAAICGLPEPRAQAELWRLALEWRARPEPGLTGHMWSAA